MADVLIAGLSTRAAADSAVVAGFRVTTIDAFGDLDVHPSVRAIALPRDFGVPFSTAAAGRAAADIVADAVVYLANFENDPGTVAALAGARALWGNSPEVLRRVRDPLVLMRAFRARAIPAPSIKVDAKDPDDLNDPHDPNDSHDPDDWLVKPIASGGGRDIRPWRGGRVPGGHYLQQRIDGAPASVVFVAARGAAVPLGVSRQLVGDAAFGADGYRYCGNILPAAGDAAFVHDEALVDRAEAVATAASAAFGLVGVNGVDFISAGGVAHPIEVNPRWSGSMELVERAYGVCLFRMHAEACVSSALPDFDLRRARRGARAVGKAILFARRNTTIGDTRPWLSDATVRDVPHPGERIAAGRPVCTIVAEAGDDAGCYAALVRRAERLYASLDRWPDGRRSW
jgi:predicted ATP-grasp superfamily ATP-dependent carboligase